MTNETRPISALICFVIGALIVIIGDETCLQYDRPSYTQVDELSDF